MHPSGIVGWRAPLLLEFLPLVALIREGLKARKSDASLIIHHRAGSREAGMNGFMSNIGNTVSKKPL